MSQIFRRSNLPSWLGGNAGPAQAPHDPQVRHWIDKKTFGKEADTAARQIEKALARKPETLDLSAVTPRILDCLPVSLLMRLKGPTQTLVLPQDCPLDLAMKLLHDIGARHIEPKPLMAAVDDALAPRPVRPPRQSLRRTPSVVAVPARTNTNTNPTNATATAMVTGTGTGTDTVVYDVPPRRADDGHNALLQRGSGIYDVPPRRGSDSDSNGYERPGSLFIPKDSGSPQRHDGKDHAVDVSPFEGSAYVEDSDYVFIEARRAPAHGADPIRSNEMAEAKEIHRQGLLLDKVTPRSSRPSLGVSTQHIDAAQIAMRLPRAWHQAHALDEGRHPRCAISAEAASALSRALLGVPVAYLSLREHESMNKVRIAFASYRPHTMMLLDPETVRHLGLALDAVTRLVASQDQAPPELPKRNASMTRPPSTRITAGG
jgi:hypothetical protein